MKTFITDVAIAAALIAVGLAPSISSAASQQQDVQIAETIETADYQG